MSVEGFPRIEGKGAKQALLSHRQVCVELSLLYVIGVVLHDFCAPHYVIIVLG